MAQNASSSKPKRVWPKLSIYKVPNFLKILNDKAYKPQMVSFGPYHHDDTMKEHKERARSRFLDRIGKTPKDCISYMKPIREEAASCYSELEDKWENEDDFLDMLILDGCFMLEVINIFHGLSSYYSEDDPIFSSHGKLYNFPVIRRDMLLIENQIPFLVLKKLIEFESTSPGGVAEEQEIEMASDTSLDGVPEEPGLSGMPLDSEAAELFADEELHFVGARSPSLFHRTAIPAKTGLSGMALDSEADKIVAMEMGYNEPMLEPVAYDEPTVLVLARAPSQMPRFRITTIPPKDQEILKTLILQFFSLSESKTDVRNCLHVLDIYRKGLLQNPSRPTTPPMTGNTKVSSRTPQTTSMTTIRCAEQLHEAGIKFQKSSSNYLDDISFNDGILTLPVLEVDDDTESKFLNLVAFERLHVDAGNNVTSYVFFMDNLINSANDVSLLSEKSIVESIIGSDEDVAKIFNKLSNELTINPDNSLREKREKIREHCQHRRNKWRANFMHTYCKSPWTIISLLIAFSYLVLAVVQTTFAIKDFYKPDDKSPSP